MKNLVIKKIPPEVEEKDLNDKRSYQKSLVKRNITVKPTFLTGSGAVARVVGGRRG